MMALLHTPEILEFQSVKAHLGGECQIALI